MSRAVNRLADYRRSFWKPILASGCGNQDDEEARCSTSRLSRHPFGASGRYRSDDDRDLSLRQMAVLLVCQSADQPQTVRGLAQHLDIAKPPVTRAVDRLERAGLAARQENPAEGRSILITITAAGRRFSNKFAGATSGKAAAGVRKALRKRCNETVASQFCRPPNLFS
jgi:DNA-binding MarR family transcriptional regulator